MKRFLVLALLFAALSCKKDLPEAERQTYYANLFAYNVMNSYYLWNQEMAAGINDWSTLEDPVAKVKSLRYKDAAGNEVDRWTELMEDCSPFVDAITGNGKTYGMEFVLYRSGNEGDVIMVVTFTYQDSPAQKAGLVRGDIVTALDGKKLTMDNYQAVLSEKIYDYPTTIKLSLHGGRTVSMTATEMYANPVHTAKTLRVGGKKIGYLHFTNFTLDACEALVEAFRQFKVEGIEDLILDLRYNTGGYAQTAQVLGSLIAPPSVVAQNAVFNRDVYNKELSASMDVETRFAESFTLPLSGGRKTLDVGGANPGVKRLWAITTGHSASASESLLCGLMPYMDVTLVGSDTYGKFCGGYLIQAGDWYNAVDAEKSEIDTAAGKRYTSGWGLYVIASRYTDCKGITRSMPSGIPADFPATDRPDDGHQLGDPAESMLAAVLALAGGASASPGAGSGRAGSAAGSRGAAGASASPSNASTSPLGGAGATLPFHRPGSGALVH